MEEAFLKRLQQNNKCIVINYDNKEYVRQSSGRMIPLDKWRYDILTQLRQKRSNTDIYMQYLEFQLEQLNNKVEVLSQVVDKHIPPATKEIASLIDFS